MNRKLGYYVSFFWATVGSIIAVLTFNDINSDAKAIFWVGFFISLFSALIAAKYFLARDGSLLKACGFLFVSGLLMPTFYAYILNIIPIGTAVWYVWKNNQKSETK